MSECLQTVAYHEHFLSRRFYEDTQKVRVSSCKGELINGKTYVVIVLIARSSTHGKLKFADKIHITFVYFCTMIIRRERRFYRINPFSVSFFISSRIASHSCSSIDQFSSTSKALDSIDDCQSTTLSLFAKLFRISKKNNDVYVRFERR